MKIEHIISAMEKVGNIQFDSEFEKFSFTKVAQDVVDPMTAQMMAQGAGMMVPQDPNTIGMQGQMPQAQMPMDPAAMGQLPPEQMGAAPSMGGQASPEETMIGESITNSDIEALVKIINILTSLKAKYDGIKSEQMQMLKDKQLSPTDPTAS
jgi:hypothetical protein